MPPPALKKLDELLRATTETDRRIAGAVVLVRYGNEILMHEAYGLRQVVPSPMPMTRDTLFDVASLTKSVCTGLLGVRLWEQGCLPLDENLLGIWGRKVPLEKEQISIRDLLCNRSGLPAWRPYFQEYPVSGCPVVHEDILQKILQEPLQARPGTAEIYSDLGYMLLGWILEDAGGAPLARMFQDAIAGPLGLMDTGFRGIGASRGSGGGRGTLAMAATENCPWRGRVLVGEVHDEHAYLLGGCAGHAGLFSTAADLDRVVQGLFQGFDDRSVVFGLKGLETFFRRQEGVAGASWALGWDTPSEAFSTTGRHFSRNSFGHNGFTGTSLWMDLDRRIAVTLLTNRVHPTRENDAIRSLRPRAHDAALEGILSVGEGG